MSPITLTDMSGESVPVIGAFPLLYNASGTMDLEASEAWVSAHVKAVQSTLAQCGAIVFRGFGLVSDADFDRFIQAFSWPNFTYAESLSNAVRRNRTPRVFTANEAPPDVQIYLHHEMAQTPVYPSRLFFFCEKPASGGGATPICRSDWLLERLHKVVPNFVDDCANKGVRYSQTMPAQDDLASGQGRSWRSTLSTDDKAAAETKLAQLGYTWRWQADDALSVTTPILPAVRELADGSRSFFNQLIAAFFGWQDSRNVGRRAITLGDGSALDAVAMQSAVSLAEELTVDLQWQPGDVALVDNLRVMHGRRPFQGERKVLASLVA